MTTRFVSAAELMCRVLGVPGFKFAVIDHPISSASNELLEASRNNPEGEALARNRYANYIGQLETDKALMQHDRASMYVTNGRTRRRLG